MYPPIRDRLLTLLANRPWAYSDPATIISDGSCLVMVTDASDTAVAVSLFRVQKPDASTVSKDDLLDPTISRLISVVHKKLDKNQVKWLTFESELYAIVLGCIKFGGFITTSTVRYHPGGVPKLLILSDSTTALGIGGRRWPSLMVSLSTCQLRHAGSIAGLTRLRTRATGPWSHVTFQVIRMTSATFSATWGKRLVPDTTTVFLHI